MNASEAQTKLKQIELLTIKEVDMIYSLARVGEWTDVEIGRRYGISKADVRRVIDNYVELRGAVQKNQHHERLPQEPSPELTTKKERKPRCDARYATPAARQKAYRARLQERRHTVIEQPSPANETDTPIPDVEEPSVTVCEAAVPEIGPEEAETQHSACYDSSVEGCDISESTPLPVTAGAWNEGEELRVIEE
jgi:hypothetical protein